MIWTAFAVLTLVTVGIGTASAEEPTTPAVVALEGADIAWMLTSSALVLMMTAPGLAMFYGGLVRKKNILGVMMKNII